MKKLIIAAVLLFAVVISCFSVSAADKTVYITSVNQSIIAGASTIFTKDYNGTNSIDTTEGNFRWVALITAEPTDKADVYKVVEKKENIEAGGVTIPENGIILAVHWDDVTDAEGVGSSLNRSTLAGFAAGDIFTLTGVDLAAGTVEDGALLTAGDHGTGAATSQADETSVEESVVESTPVSEAESTVESADVSEASDASEVSEPASETSVAEESGEGEETKKDNTLIIVIIAIAAVAVIAVVVVVVLKNKKK